VFVIGVDLVEVGLMTDVLNLLVVHVKIVERTKNVIGTIIEVITTKLIIVTTEIIIGIMEVIIITTEELMATIT